MKLSDLCGFYDVYSNDRKTPKDCPDIFYNTDLAPKPEYTAVPASLILIICADGRTDDPKFICLNNNRTKAEFSDLVVPTEANKDK